MKCHSKAVQECKLKEETLSESWYPSQLSLLDSPIVLVSYVFYCVSIGGETPIDGRYSHREVNIHREYFLLICSRVSSCG